MIGISAQMIATALGGCRAGGGWVARCPAHDDRDPSLSVRDGDNGKVLVCCHAGCEQQAVIASLRSLGLWQEQVGRRDRFARSRPRPASNPQAAPEDERRSAAALSIWQSCLPATEGPVASYLRSRRIHLPAPPSLRFHNALKHPAGGFWPAMVALVTSGSDEKPIAIHRTFVARDGIGKAPVDPQKMMFGPCRGGAVRLGAPAGILMVGEGIETCLAAMQATGNAAWAALSTSGLRALDLPADVREVIVLADGDDPGEAAARECAHRWRREGRRVRVARPPRGLDFNDILMGSSAATEEGVA